MLKPRLHHHVCKVPVVVALALSAPAVLADDQAPSSKADGPCGDVGTASRFAAFHDNYALLNQMSNNGWTQRDEVAVRGQLSVKYSFFGCPQRRDKNSNVLELTPLDADVKAELAKARGRRLDFKQWFSNAEYFVSFTNRFDFYMGTRDSGPVINRVSNPGLHARFPSLGMLLGDAQSTQRDAWQFSLEHMSDGQVAEPVKSDQTRLQAQQAYAHGEKEDRYFFDTISRGMNYLAVQGEWVWGAPEDGAAFDVQAKVKGYLTSDSAITWGPLADQGLRFADYERVTVRLGAYLQSWGRFELTSQFGDSGFKHASYTLSWQYNLKSKSSKLDLPLFVQLHHGPMNTLSNYTQRQDSIGFGLRLAY